jgi:hypothetical protein
MSCFVVNDYHVSALVAWAVRAGVLPDAVSPDALAHDLAEANRAAFHERYAGDYADEVTPFEGLDRSAGAALAPVAIVKACDCLAYQCSDWAAWAASEAAAHLAAIRATAQAQCLAGRYYPEPRRDLPGYDDAPWCLDRPESDPDLVAEARATVAALQGLAVHPSHYAGLVAALERAGAAA